MLLFCVVKSDKCFDANYINEVVHIQFIFETTDVLLNTEWQCNMLSSLIEQGIQVWAKVDYLRIITMEQYCGIERNILGFFTRLCLTDLLSGGQTEDRLIH